jgi:hypothetical protein
MAYSFRAIDGTIRRHAALVQGPESVPGANRTALFHVVAMLVLTHAALLVVVGHVSGAFLHHFQHSMTCKGQSAVRHLDNRRILANVIFSVNLAGFPGSTRLSEPRRLLYSVGLYQFIRQSSCACWEALRRSSGVCR